MFDRSRFQSGADVYSRDNHKIGSVENVGPNYIEISTGFLGLGHHYYVPFDAVSRVDEADRSVYLSVDKDNLHLQGWETPPTGAMAGRSMGTEQTVGAGTMTGTMPSATAERPTTENYVDAGNLQGQMLYDWNEDQIGRIDRVTNDYAVVPTGIAGLGDTLFVPFDAISYCTRDGCYVHASIDQIKGMNWNEAPTGANRNAGAGFTGQTGQPFRVPLYEEELQARRHREQVGEVVVRRNVEQEQRTINVPVERQEVTIERHDVDRDVPAGTQPFAEGQQEFRVPVYEEKVDVEKVPRVREEVVVQPEQVTEQRQFTDTVRRETADVDTSGNAGQFVNRGGTSAGFRPWAEAMPTYRQDWERQYGTSGRNWSDVEPAYQFGYNRFYDPS